MTRSALAASDLIARLSGRHRPPEWAFFEQVPSGTGGGATRTADAVAMNLWPSRGLEVHGFEVKISRNDWIRELKAPQKADEIAGYCDRFWLVVSDATIVHPGELPATWGLMGPRGDGLVTVKEPAKLDSRPLDRAFVAAILRKATSGVVPKSELEARVDEVRARLVEAHADQHERDEERNRELAAAIAEFEKRSGVRIHEWSAGEVGDAVKALLDGSAERVLRGMEHARTITERSLADIDERIAAIRAAMPAATSTGTEG
jgi:hypothetical protein